MSYRLKRRESVRDGLRRIADEQLVRAIAEIDDAPRDPVEAVHAVRKRFKMLRGLLRLVRSANPRLHERENATFRDAAERLSGVRDADVLTETFDVLTARFADEENTRKFGPIRDALTRRRNELGERLDLEDRLAEARSTIAESRERVRDWSLDEKGFAAVSGGLGATYDRARRALRTARTEETPEAFHEWRKQAKYHWYHTRLLRNVWRATLETRRGELSNLADQLGNLHDIAVFDDVLRTESERFADERATTALRGLVETATRELRCRALPLGLRLFAEKPAAHVKRIEAYWRAWRKG